MSDDLIAFLRARLAEDEAVARAATAGPWSATHRADGTHSVRGGHASVPGQPSGDRIVHRDGGYTADWPQDVVNPAADAEHIARHDPARILAEVEAKRRFLARYEEVTAAGAASGAYSDVQEEYDWLLNLMWAPYADHPDFDEEWRP